MRLDSPDRRVLIGGVLQFDQAQGKSVDENDDGIDPYRSDEELYEKAKNVDAVIISTADFQHAMHTLHAVKAGKDCYTEKPYSEDMRNWMECIRSRKQPNAPIEASYSHAVALIMSNASLHTGMKATFDKATRQVMAGGKVFKGY